MILKHSMCVYVLGPKALLVVQECAVGRGCDAPVPRVPLCRRRGGPSLSFSLSAYQSSASRSHVSGSLRHFVYRSWVLCTRAPLLTSHLCVSLCLFCVCLCVSVWWLCRWCRLPRWCVTSAATTRDTTSPPRSAHTGTHDSIYTYMQDLDDHLNGTFIGKPPCSVQLMETDGTAVLYRICRYSYSPCYMVG